MNRILFKQTFQKKFLDNIKKNSGLNLTQLAKICNTNKKNLSDWYTEKSTITFNAAELLSKKFFIKIPNEKEIVSEFWYTKKAGRLGGLKRVAKHGNPGTKDGRKLGGTKSKIVNYKLHTSFKSRKKINIPKMNKETAEMFGIIMGDGGITYHQLTISLNRYTDKEYAEWVCKRLEEMFKIGVSKKDKNNVSQIVLSGINVIEFLLANGLSRGNKVKNGVDIPRWIKGKKNLEIYCIRGLIDTDGCIYFDKHNYKNVIYKNICIDFTSASPKLLNSVYKILTKLGLEPRMYRRSIKIRKLKNVKKYFDIIGSHNIKHINKFKNLLEGGVA